MNKSDAEKSMSAERPRAEPMSVDVVGNKVILDGVPNVEVALTPEAAIETGVRLVNAGIGIDDGAPTLPLRTTKS